VQPHQLPVGGLAQRVLAQQRLRVSDCLLVVCRLFGPRSESLHHSDVALSQAITLGEQPLVVTPGKQIAAVRGGGLRQRTLIRGELELGHVQRERRIRPPLNRRGGQLEVAVRLGEPCPQVVCELAQVGPSLPIGRIRPQQERHALPGLRGVAVQQQKSQQRLNPARLQPPHPLGAVEHVELAQQPNAQHAEDSGAEPPDRTWAVPYSGPARVRERTVRLPFRRPGCGTR
jgi:hypothetical protein